MVVVVVAMVCAVMEVVVVSEAVGSVYRIDAYVVGEVGEAFGRVSGEVRLTVVVGGVTAAVAVYNWMLLMRLTAWLLIWLG